MNRYDLYVLDMSGRVVDSLPFRTGGDDEACALALHIAGERRFELWHGKRRVHCSHQGPSLVEGYSEVASAIFYGATPVWFRAGAVRV